MKRVTSPVTGTLRSYTVQVGDTVSDGQEVAVIEAMKMMLPILAETSGKVTKLAKPINDVVHEGDTLIELA